MNILVQLLQHEPKFIDEALEARVIKGEALERLLEEALPDRWAEVVGDASVRQQLDEAYIPLIDAEIWESALARALQDEPVVAPEWVSMVPSSSAPVGVTVPQDAGSAPRASMFIRRRGRTRSLSLELGAGPPLGAGIATSVGSRHCGTPDDGVCSPGLCGDCRVRRREDGGEWGLICWCEH